MALNLYIPVGIPGSGKSTWTERMLEACVISSDQIRKELFGSLRAAHDVDDIQKKINNDRVWGEYYTRIERTLPNDNVIADATHLRAFARARLTDIAERVNAMTHVIIFNNPEQALKRNKERLEDANVPDQVMEVFCRQLRDAIFDIEEKESYATITRIQCLN